MDALESPTSRETTVNTGLTVVSLDRQLLRRRVTDFQLAVLAEARALAAEHLADAFAEIDRAIDKALVVPQLRRGAPREEVAAVVRQATVLKETVKESLRQRLANVWQQDRQALRSNTEYARRRNRIHTTETPIVTRTVASVPSQLPPARPAERRLVLADKV
jgi:hypothetical protein